MKYHRQRLLSLLLISLFGIGMFYVGTDGFTAFTAEKARMNQLVKEQPSVPKVMFEDNAGREYAFNEFEGKYVWMTFFYTACSTVCPQLEKNVAEIYQAIPDEYIGEDIVFLSVSFDSERDTPEILDRYRTFFDSDGETWRMARVADETELQALLDSFGVIALPDGAGDYTHNVAFYLVNPDGYLVDVLDFDDVEGATASLLDLLEGEG